MYGDSVAKMCEASLERMNMEYFDIYWIHNPIGAPEYTKQLIPLLQSGKVKSVGVSNHDLAQIKEADEILKVAGFRVSAVQNHYSLLNRSSEKSGILDCCKTNDIVFTTEEVASLEAAADKSVVSSIQFWESKME